VYGSCVWQLCVLQIIRYTLYTVQHTPDSTGYKHPVHGTQTEQCTLTVDSHIHTKQCSMYRTREQSAVQLQCSVQYVTAQIMKVKHSAVLYSIAQ
jgi:hypothetical protein